MLRDVIKQFCNLIGLQDSCSRVQIAVKLDARPSHFALVRVAPPDYMRTVSLGLLASTLSRRTLHQAASGKPLDFTFLVYY